MCNENVNENAQMRPVDRAEAKIDLGDSPILPYNPFLVKSSRLINLARENDYLTEKIFRLKAFLEGKQCEKIAGAKQVELMRGQLKAMENYKFFLSCRIADLALSIADLAISDVEQSEEKNGHNMKATKKPVTIECFKYDGDLMNSEGKFYVPDWAEKAYNDGVIYFKDQGEMYIKTLEGDHHASVGDYVIKGVNGELYPCKPDIFEKTYDIISK